MAPPQRKKQKRAYNNDKLPHNMLAEIFKHLPPIQRWRMNAVCRRWRVATLLAWTDVICLDISDFPSLDISAVIKQCPNLRNIFAKWGKYRLDELVELATLDLKTAALTFDKCTFIVDDETRSSAWLATTPQRLSGASWKTLVLRNVRFKDRRSALSRRIMQLPLPLLLPASLMRLELHADPYNSSAWEHLSTNGDEHRIERIKEQQAIDSLQLFLGLEKLTQLECLCLRIDDLESLIFKPRVGGEFYRSFACLKCLSELHFGQQHGIGWAGGGSAPLDLVSLALELPKLEVLWLTNVPRLKTGLGNLTTKHPTLRILIIDESDEALSIPARCSNEPGSAPLPLLHIFLGPTVSKRVHFEKSETDVLRIYCTDQPIENLLTEMKSLLSGVWIVENYFNGKQLDSYYPDK